MTGSRVSSTPRLRSLITNVSGILDHPFSRVMTARTRHCMTATLSKADLRAAALAKRDALSDEQRAAAAQGLAKRGLPVAITPGMVVSGYSPIRSEIDPVPLMRKLAAQGARLALPAVTGARQVAGVSRVVARRPADARTARHSRAVARRCRNDSRYHAGAAGGIRPSGPSHRLWRRPLRLHARAFAQGESHHGHRHRLRGAGNQGRAGVAARRGAGLCANGKRKCSISGV